MSIPATAAAAVTAATDCRGKQRQRPTEADRLRADIARMPFEPHTSSAKDQAAQTAQINKWMAGVAFEQLWVGKHVIDVFPLAPAGSSRYLSDLQPALFRLLHSSIPQRPNEPLEENDLDGLGFGITVRRIRSHKPVGASAQLIAESTAAHRGVMVAGCVVQPLYSVQLRDPISRQTTRHHAFYLHYAATKESEQRKGFMRFLLDGQLRLMAATLPNGHSSRNSIFVNSTRRHDRCIYRKHFEFKNDVSASQFDHALLQSKSNTVLCSKTVRVEVDHSGNAMPPPMGQETAADARLRLILAIRKLASPLPVDADPKPQPQPQQEQEQEAEPESEPEMELEPPPPLERPRAYSFTFAAAATPAAAAAAAHAATAVAAAAASGHGHGHVHTHGLPRGRVAPRDVIDLVSSSDDDDGVKEE